MNDETSQLHGELGKALLSAGRDEWPSDEALSRTLAAIGAGAAVVATTGAVAAAGASAGTAAKGSAVVVSFASIAKWLGMGALGGVVVAGVAHEITPQRGAPLEPKAMTAPAPKAQSEANDRVRAQKPQAEPAPIAAPESEPPKVAERPHDVTRERAEQAERVPLAAEVALVDRARTALASGSALRALEELRAYESAFPEPRLLPEVLFLRMEAHLASGNAARARDTAEQSVRLFPRSPHAARARDVIDGRVEEKK